MVKKNNSLLSYNLKDFSDLTRKKLIFLSDFVVRQLTLNYGNMQKLYS